MSVLGFAIIVWCGISSAQENLDINSMGEAVIDTNSMEVTPLTPEEVPSAGGSAQDGSQGFEEYRPDSRMLEAGSGSENGFESWTPPQVEVIEEGVQPFRNYIEAPTMEFEAVPPPPQVQEAFPVPSAAPPPSQYIPTGFDISLDKEYEQELVELERQIALLKQRVLETKGRIIQYGERVTQGFTSGTKIMIHNINNLGGDFRVESITYWVDGHQIYYKGDPVNFLDQEDLLVYEGSILPGRHKLDVKIILRGDEGAFDFSYSSRLKLTFSHYFTADQGQTQKIRVINYDKGGWFSEIQDRPDIMFNLENIGY
jgi:hypothetical protein